MAGQEHWWDIQIREFGTILLFGTPLLTDEMIARLDADRQITLDDFPDISSAAGMDHLALMGELPTPARQIPRDKRSHVPDPEVYRHWGEGFCGLITREDLMDELSC